VFAENTSGESIGVAGAGAPWDEKGYAFYSVQPTISTFTPGMGCGSCKVFESAVAGRHQRIAEFWRASGDEPAFQSSVCIAAMP